LQQIWQNVQLTNQGPLLLEFERRVSQYLEVTNFHFVSNGTTALQLALRVLGVDGGEVITTPFSYVATSSSILWEHCRPVYVDIDPGTLCIDPDKIEAAITERTKAIMPVHVFGNPCDIEKIDAIAKKHKLKVIYDAAHAFGVIYKGRSLLDYGDISIGSFHSTKLFHTIEGGCLVVKDTAVSEAVELTKRFGHNGDEHITLGINAKASEFQAAMGLCNIKYVSANMEGRRLVTELYDRLLGGTFKRPQTDTSDTIPNYGYYPILFESEHVLKETFKKLNQENIYPRRYFFPSLNKLPYLTGTQSCPISEDIALRSACLPLYSDLSPAIVQKICEVLTA
jgi:dTDP-4-amino-4,6-dideoxygalactose transaminase